MRAVAGDTPLEGRELGERLARERLIGGRVYLGCQFERRGRAAHLGHPDYRQKVHVLTPLHRPVRRPQDEESLVMTPGQFPRGRNPVKSVVLVDRNRLAHVLSTLRSENSEGCSLPN